MWTQMVRASTVVNVQVPAQGCSMACDKEVVATHSEAKCNATITAGTRMNFTVDWNDGSNNDVIPTAGRLMFSDILVSKW